MDAPQQVREAGIGAQAVEDRLHAEVIHRPRAPRRPPTSAASRVMCAGDTHGLFCPQLKVSDLVVLR